MYTFLNGEIVQIQLNSSLFICAHLGHLYSGVAVALEVVHNI